jgi:hypothetical protein
MTRNLIAAALVLAAFAHPAFASFAPITYQSSRELIAEACTKLGKDGQGWGLDATQGDFGCRNLATGNTVKCREDGSCTDYSGDPRWKNIQTILKGGKLNRRAQAA